MASPTAITLENIVEEGLKKAGYTNPLSTQTALVSRAEDIWMREIKNDIVNSKNKLMSLQTETIQPLVIGRSRYDLPSDFLSLVSMTLLDGEHSGAAQAGSAGTITFESTESIGDDCTGKEVVLINGTGSGQSSQIYSYDTTTKIANIYPEWTANPTSGTGYLIVDNYYKLNEHPVWDYDREQYKFRKDKPSSYFPIGDESNGEFILLQAPDKEYAIKIRYYADLMRLDLDGILMSTLYRKWQNVFILGIWAKALVHQDDPNAIAAKNEYSNAIAVLTMREGYGSDLSNIVMRIDED